jgi:predicted nucleotidyltransferase
MERRRAFQALVGSHNYNLNREESDRDWKLFVFPTFDDLYNGRMYSHTITGKTDDVDIHDIRRLSDLLFKSNINFVETLFSQQYAHFVGVNVQFLHDNRDRIARMNLPYLFRACIGMHLNKLRDIDKGTEGTQHLVQLYGYDTKQAMQSYRVLDFLHRFYDNDFTDFKKAIWYTEDERRKLWDIKDGAYTRNDFVDMVTAFKDQTQAKLEKAYTAQPVDEEMKEQLDEWVMVMVRESIYMYG